MLFVLLVVCVHWRLQNRCVRAAGSDICSGWLLWGLTGVCSAVCLRRRGIGRLQWGWRGGSGGFVGVLVLRRRPLAVWARFGVSWAGRMSSLRLDGVPVTCLGSVDGGFGPFMAFEPGRLRSSLYSWLRCGLRAYGGSAPSRGTGAGPSNTSADWGKINRVCGSHGVKFFPPPPSPRFAPRPLPAGSCGGQWQVRLLRR